MKRRRDINLGATGCLCWETSTYSPDCCDPDDPKAEQIGRTRGPLTPPEPPPPEPSLGYGLLYNWYAATDERGIAPDGWRVPSESDVDSLIAEINSQYLTIISDRVLTDGDPYWTSGAGTNETGFTAFGAGGRFVPLGTYGNIRLRGFFRTTTINSQNSNFDVSLVLGGAGNFKGGEDINTGTSIRCLRDTLPPSPTVIDADGNTYTWVQIGAQYWLAQNLKTTKYNNGDPIPTGLDDAAWTATTDGAYAFPNGDDTLPI